MNFGSGGSKEEGLEGHLGSGQGINAIKEVLPTSALVGRLKSEYAAARERISL